MVNVSLVQDKIAVRAVGFYSRTNGYIDNKYLNIININDTGIYGGRILVRLTPVEDLTIDATAYLNWASTDTPSWVKEAGRYNANWPVRLPLSDHIQLYSLTGVYDFAEVALKGLGTYPRRHFDSSVDDSRFVRPRRTRALCTSLTNRGAACNATKLASYYGVVDSLSSSLLYPIQDMDS
jgi:iron complex outermembrane receptor protein